MLVKIEALLATITEVLSAMIGAITDVVGFIAGQPLLLIAIMLSVVGFVFASVRSWVRQ